MRQTNQTGNVEQSYRTLIIIWFALLFSQLMFLVILFVVKREIFKFNFSESLFSKSSSMVIIFAILGISTFLLSFILSKKFISQAVREQKMALVQTSLIIGCALCKATTLFGYILAFVLNYQYFFLWFALGILGMILHFPRRENLIDASYNKVNEILSN